MNRILEAIKQLLSAAVADATSPLYFHATTNPLGIKAVYFGDPVQIPESSHPALVVHPVSSAYTKRGTRYDQKIHTIEIKLVDNVKNYLSTSPSDTEKVPSVERFGNMIEQVDANQETASNTICGIIQNSPNLPYLDPLNEDAPANASIDARVSRVDYVFNSARGYPTFEAIISVDVVAQGDR